MKNTHASPLIASPLHPYRSPTSTPKPTHDEVVHDELIHVGSMDVHLVHLLHPLGGVHGPHPLIGAALVSVVVHVCSHILLPWRGRGGGGKGLGWYVSHQQYFQRPKKEVNWVLMSVCLG